MDRTRLLFVIMVVVGSINASIVRAQTLSYADAIQQFAAACDADIRKHCKGIELGGGRIRACLDANQGAISAQCQQARSRIYASIARRVAAQRDITKICASDILRFCGSVTPGDANILNCMMAVSPSAIGRQCNQAFNDTGWRTETVQQ
jgi:hypothetical protein